MLFKVVIFYEFELRQNISASTVHKLVGVSLYQCFFIVPPCFSVWRGSSEVRIDHWLSTHFVRQHFHSILIAIETLLDLWSF